MNVWIGLLVISLSTWGFLSLMVSLTTKLEAVAANRRRLTEERLALKEKVSDLERRVDTTRLKADEALHRLAKLTEDVHTRGYRGGRD